MATACRCLPSAEALGGVSGWPPGLGRTNLPGFNRSSWATPGTSSGLPWSEGSSPFGTEHRWSGVKCTAIKERVGGGDLRKVRFQVKPREEKSRDKLRWEAMMREIQVADDPVVVLQSALQQRQVTKVEVVGTLIRLKQLKRWRILGQLLSWLEVQTWWPFTPMDYAMLIMAYARGGFSARLGEARAVFERAQAAGVGRNIFTYTAMLEVLMRAEDFEQAEVLLAEMEAHGPAPTLLTYQIMISGYSSAKRIDDVERTLRRVEERAAASGGASNFVAEREVETAGVSSRSTRGRGATEAEASGHGREWAEGGGRGGGEGGEVGRVQRIRPLSPPDERTYNAVLRAYVRAGDFGRMEGLLGRLERGELPGVSPSLATFNTALHAYALQGNVGDAEAVFQRLQASGLKPNVISYTALMAVFSNVGDSEMAQSVFEDMLASKIRPTLKTYTALLQAYGRAGKLPEAYSVFKEMHRNRYRPDTWACTVMLQAFVRGGELVKARELFQQMELHGPIPNAWTFAVIIDGFATAQDLTTAFKYLDRMRDANLTPHLQVYASIMGAYADGGQLKEALLVFQEMVDSGVNPDLGVRSTLLNAAEGTPEEEQVRELMAKYFPIEAKQDKQGPRERSGKAAGGALGSAPKWDPIAGEEGYDSFEDEWLTNGIKLGAGIDGVPI